MERVILANEALAEICFLDYDIDLDLGDTNDFVIYIPYPCSGHRIWRDYPLDQRKYERGPGPGHGNHMEGDAGPAFYLS